MTRKDEGMTQADEPMLLEMDSRRRVNLSGLARHDRYLAEVEENGTITLTPAVVMGTAEFVRLMADCSGNTPEYEAKHRERTQHESARDPGRVEVPQA